MVRYVTTTLPFINGKPHFGHTLEFVEADFFVRALRAKGEEIFFNIGTDEHGAKIAKRAAEEGKDPQKYADEYASIFKSFADNFDISYNAFTRTTDAHHMTAAQEMWRRCQKAGDIYKASYQVKYCVGCELEKTDSELVNGRCPLHSTLEIEINEEENYYFRFSKYRDVLLAQYRKQTDFVIPDERRREIIAFAEAGFKDFSVSRRKDKISWGVPVPGDEDHVMYVWFDALTNYISVLGWPENEESFEKWWPAIQFAGKDNLRQQSAMWQSMLLSADLPLSKQILIHGNIISGGIKMSKTLGNVIDPMAVAETYGTDAVRYILLRHASPFEDSDITETFIRELYTSHLTNGLGNLVARVMKLAEEHLSEPVVLVEDDEKISTEFSEKIEAFRFNEAMDSVFAKIADADAYMNMHEPYKKIKIDAEAARKDIEHLVRVLANIATHLVPAMPNTSQKILNAIKENKKPDNLFPRL